MKTCYKINGMSVLLTLVLVMALCILYGCSKSESAKVDTATAAAAYPSPEQTTCPITGGSINKDIYTVYQGKKVYFCCEGCKRAFEKHPEKYLDKLPQFAK
jgi:YHS domain-containing protein